MSNLAPVKPTQIAELNQEQIEILRSTVFKDLNDEEMRFAIQVCNRTQLDPFLRQLYFVKRLNNKTGKDDIAIQTGIDGFRLIAQRTGSYAGSDEPAFDNEAKPKKATVTVYKMVQGVRCPFSASARWDEYYPGDKMGFMWRKMPFVMLGKCAEAQALRKAFPAELSDVYTSEEMQQADSSGTVIKTKAEEVTEVLIQEKPEILQPETPPAPEHCGRPMMVSKYHKDTWYCLKCKAAIAFGEVPS